MTASSDDGKSVASGKQRLVVNHEEISVEEKEAVVPSGGVVKNDVVPEDTLEALEEIREAQEEQATEEAEEVIESKAKEIIAERGEEQEHKEVIEQKQEESSAPERGVDDEERPSAEEEERKSRSSEKSRRKSSSLMNSTQTKSHSARETGGRTSGERRKGRPNPSVERREGRTRTSESIWRACLNLTFFGNISALSNSRVEKKAQLSLSRDKHAKRKRRSSQTDHGAHRRAQGQVLGRFIPRNCD